MTNPGLSSTMSMAYYSGGSRPPSKPTTPSHSTTSLPTTAALASGSSLPSSTPGSHPYNQGRNVSNPKSASTDEFNFNVPSLPPRLANFGRKISQMGNDFLSEFEDPGPRRSIEAPKPIPSPTPEDVPGMGDEPVMCPFCEKPLPPMLFASHNHTVAPKTVKAASVDSRPGTLKRSNTTTGVKPRIGMRESSFAAPLREERLLEALPVNPSRAPSPSINADALRAEVTAADKANAYAAGLVVSHADLRRWAAMAGLGTPTPSRSASETEKTIPRIAPPPSGITTSRPQSSRGSSTSSVQFEFAKKATESKAKKEVAEDDDSDGAGQGQGYSMLTGAGSDTDEEEKMEVLHDEPEESSDADGPLKQAAVARPETPETPEVTPQELKSALQEVLAKLGEMSQSHTALLSSQSTILTSLKIARSNLAMAEANTEMLEAQLKQRPAISSPGGPAASPRIVSTPTLAQPRAIPASSGVAQTRRSEDRQRPMSLQMPNNTAGPASAGGMPGSQGEKSGWGFWNNGKKKTGGSTITGNQMLNSFPSNFPSPSMERPGYDFTNGMSVPYSAAATPSVAKGDLQRVSAEYGSLQRSASYTHLPTSPPRMSSIPAAPGVGAELAKVKESFVAATKKMEAMQKELTELKKGKLEMEAELENLSQALFEEANKMVADERKRRAEVEESLKEVREEREVLRQTIKVLGGQGPVVDNAASLKGRDADAPKGDVGGDSASKPETPVDDFMPRDLDKHYEALRKSIHHVSDGAVPTRSSFHSPEQSTTRFQRGRAGSASEASGVGGAEGSALSDGEEAGEGRTGKPDGKKVTFGDQSPKNTATEEISDSERDDREERDEDKRASAIITPIDPNPWANADPFSGDNGDGLSKEDKRKSAEGEREGWASEAS